MKKVILAASALLMLSTLVFSFQANVSWIPPSAYTDGSVLLEQDLDFYTLYCGGVQTATIDSVIGVTSWQMPDGTLPVGSHTCHLTVTTLPDAAGNVAESGPSNSVNFTIGPLVPGAPAGLVILL